MGATMWPHRRADEAPLPRVAEGHRARGVHREPLPRRADEAPLSNAGAFFFLAQMLSKKFSSNMF